MNHIYYICMSYSSERVHVQTFENCLGSYCQIAWIRVRRCFHSLSCSSHPSPSCLTDKGESICLLKSWSITNWKKRYRQIQVQPFFLADELLIPINTTPVISNSSGFYTQARLERSSRSAIPCTHNKLTSYCIISC